MGPLLNWLDAKLFGAMRSILSSGVEQPERPALNFLPPLSAVDNPTTNTTDVMLGSGGPGRFVSTDILIVGESNASGATYTPAGGYPAGDPPYSELEGPDLLTWNGSSWVQANTQQSGEVTGSIGLFAGALGRRMLNEGVSRVRIMMATQSGQGVSYFNPTNPAGGYAAMVAQLRAASFNPGLIIWWQGESDENQPQGSIEPNLGDLLASELVLTSGHDPVRLGWLRDAVPSCQRIVVVRTHRGITPGSDITGVRAAQEAWVEGNPRLIRLVDIDDLVDGGERYEAAASLPHFLWYGYEEVARRCVEAMW